MVNMCPLVEIALFDEVGLEYDEVSKISDYIIQGKTGEILPKLVEQVERLRS